MTDQKGSTLTDARGMGGLIAQDGFDYQAWDALVRIPAWLRTPAFEGLTLEGFEDTEARFFAPTAPHGHVLDRFQAKSSTALSRTQVTEVFRGFVEFDQVYPGIARAHVLVTPALPKDLQWLTRNVERVRRARPFYAPFKDIVATNDEELRRAFVREFSAELGAKIARSVEVDLRSFPNRRTAEAMFASAIEDAFPGSESSVRRAAEAFRALVDHIGSRRGQMVDRHSLLGILRDTLSAPVPTAGSVHVHVRSDRNALSEHAIEIDASAFSGTDGPFPSPEEWQTALLAPLERTARWMSRQGQSRVRLTGSYRISTALALGWSFRGPTGFEIEIVTRDGDWATDERPTATDSTLPWKITPPTSLHRGRLVVSVGVLRDPAPSVQAALQLAHADEMLCAHLDQPITNGRDAQASVQAIKSAVAAATARLSPQGIDLFFAGPAALAVAIGHRWNALPVTHLHEFRSGQGYIRSAVLG